VTEAQGVIFSLNVFFFFFFLLVCYYSCLADLAVRFPGVQRPVDEYGPDRAAAAAGAKEEDGDDDDFDLFGDDDEEEVN
jgi:Na+-transporting methylmalonyl-CoA/oxaloacetate decarboxylase gamma subunit